MDKANSKKLACVIARILDDKKGLDIQILNISSVSVVSDYFVIASGTSSPHVKGMTSDVREKVKEFCDRLPERCETDPKNRWNLVDYGDVVVHIMHKEQREAYALEKFWSHALKINREVWEEESKEFSLYK